MVTEEVEEWDKLRQKNTVCQQALAFCHQAYAITKKDKKGENNWILNYILKLPTEKKPQVLSSEQSNYYLTLPFTLPLDLKPAAFHNCSDS